MPVSTGQLILADQKALLVDTHPHTSLSSPIAFTDHVRPSQHTLKRPRTDSNTPYCYFQLTAIWLNNTPVSTSLGDTGF